MKPKRVWDEAQSNASVDDRNTHNLFSRRRRIWDEYDDDDNDEDDTFDHQNEKENTMAPTTNNTSSGSSCDNVHVRMVSMKKELVAKAQHVRQLKADLTRRNVMNERNLQDLRSSLRVKLEEQKLQHETAMLGQRDLLKSIQHDCLSMDDRADTISGEINQIISSQQRMCRTLEVAGRRELDKAKGKWRTSEKNRLANLLRERSATMKQDAARQLEPELVAILKRSKKEKQSKQEALANETNELRAKLQSEHESNYSQTCRSMHDELERKLADIEVTLQDRFRQLSLKHADEMEMIRREWSDQVQADASAFDVDLRRREGDHTNSVASLRDQEERDASSALAAHRQTMIDLKACHKDALEAKKSAAHESVEEWKLQRKQELQNQSDTLEKEAISGLQGKVENEIALVSSTLRLEAKEKQSSLEREATNHVSAVEASLELEIKAARRRNEEAAIESNHMQSKKYNLAKLAHELQSKESLAKSELSDGQQALDKAMLDAKALEVKSDRDLRSAQSAAKEAADGARRMVRSIESSLKIFVEEESGRKAERLRSEDELRLRNEEELRTVKSRICELVRRKEEKLQIAEEELRQKKSEAESLEKAVEEARMLPSTR